MPFIGNQPALSYTSFAKQDFSTSATTSYTLDNPGANANELALFINFVRQEPGSYSASGTTLTLTEATSSSDDMYCVYLGKAVQTVNPPNASVGTSQLASSLDLSSKTITLASNMTNTPSFWVKLSGTQSIADNTQVDIQFNNEQLDTDNCFNTSTYTFTPNVAGYYFINVQILLNAQNPSDFFLGRVFLLKNGSQEFFAQHDNRNTASGFGQTISAYGIVYANGTTDAFKIAGLCDENTGGNIICEPGQYSRFSGFKLIGV